MWSENGDELATGETATIANLDAGIHIIELVVTDGDGATDTDSLIVEVEAIAVNLPPEPDAGRTQTLTEGDILTLDGSGSIDRDGTIESYEWTESGQPFASGEIAIVEDLPEGDYLITLTVTDDVGDTGTDRLQVFVEAAEEPNAPPQADAGDDQMLVEGDVLVLDGRNSSDAEGLIASFEWFDGATSIAIGETAMVSGLAADDYVIRLEVTDSEGLMDTDTLAVSIVAAPIIVENELPEAELEMGDDVGGADSNTVVEELTVEEA